MINEKPQYSTAIDAVIYGDATSEFAARDWLALAMAALDQAGLRPAQYDQVARLVRDDE